MEDIHLQLSLTSRCCCLTLLHSLSSPKVELEGPPLMDVEFCNFRRPLLPVFCDLIVSVTLIWKQMLSGQGAHHHSQRIVANGGRKQLRLFSGWLEGVEGMQKGQ